MFKHALTLALILSLALPAFAEPVVIFDATGAQAGKYYIEVTVDAQGHATARRVTNVVTMGGGPAPGPQPQPQPPPVGPLEQEVKRLTEATLANGGTKTTGAALAAVYGLVRDGVKDNKIPPDNAIPAIRAATDAVLKAQPDGQAWQGWRTSIGGALDKLRQDGSLATKGDYVYALGEISNGLRSASGASLVLASLPELATDAQYRERIKASGILDGINLQQLIELVKLIVELLKLFGVGKGGGVDVGVFGPELR